VRDRLRALRPHAEREAFLTLDFPVGAAARVDWADFRFALPGCPCRVSAFVMVLCYSRCLYLEFTSARPWARFSDAWSAPCDFFREPPTSTSSTT
jgi:transposase